MITFKSLFRKKQKPLRDRWVGRTEFEQHQRTKAAIQRMNFQIRELSRGFSQIDYTAEQAGNALMDFAKIEIRP